MWGVDPSVFAPVDVPKEFDITFYGHGAEFREEWITSMIAAPSRERGNVRFAVGGQLGMDIGRARRLGKVKLSSWRRLCSASRINLNITREHHAKVFASSTSRPFELAMGGCCIVSNPVNGLDQWFQPEREIFVVHSEKEALDTYDYLLASPDVMEKAGKAARTRALREHTHRHRARQILAFIKRLT
jgi:spore maturation protein CgeB